MPLMKGASVVFPGGVFEVAGVRGFTLGAGGGGGGLGKVVRPPVTTPVDSASLVSELVLAVSVAGEGLGPEARVEIGAGGGFAGATAVGAPPETEAGCSVLPFASRTVMVTFPTVFWSPGLTNVDDSVA